MSDWSSMLLAAPLLACALMVVMARDIVRAILWLGAVLAWTSVLYASLDAGFLAGMQLLLYAGGVVTLMIVGVMVTSREAGVANDDRRGGIDWRAALTALAMFGVVASGLVGTTWSGPSPEVDQSTKRLGELLLAQHAVAFEVLSLLLLAGMLGAIVLTRKGAIVLTRKDAMVSTRKAVGERQVS